MGEGIDSIRRILGITPEGEKFLDSVVALASDSERIRHVKHAIYVKDHYVREQGDSEINYEIWLKAPFSEEKSLVDYLAGRGVSYESLNWQYGGLKLPRITSQGISATFWYAPPEQEVPKKKQDQSA